MVDYTDEQEETKTSCNKGTGTRKKLQKWTRGHLFVVTEFDADIEYVIIYSNFLVGVNLCTYVRVSLIVPSAAKRCW